jgi:hypothetical protein
MLNDFQSMPLFQKYASEMNVANVETMEDQMDGILFGVKGDIDWEKEIAALNMAPPIMTQRNGVLEAQIQLQPGQLQQLVKLAKKLQIVAMQPMPASETLPLDMDIVEDILPSDDRLLDKQEQLLHSSQNDILLSDHVQISDIQDQINVLLRQKLENLSKNGISHLTDQEMADLAQNVADEILLKYNKPDQPESSAPASKSLSSQKPLSAASLKKHSRKRGKLFKKP